MKGRWILWPGFVLSLSILGACSRIGQADQTRTQNSLRIATYNIQWFSEEANPDRISNIRAVFKDLAPDLVAFQEVQSLKAAKQIFDESYEIGMLDAPDEQQECGLAVKKPSVLVSTEAVFPEQNLDDAFPGRRDVIRCVVQTPNEKQLIVYVVHMKSRRGGRMQTDSRRQMACSLLAAYIRGRSEEKNVVVLGDFNDNPRDVSLNILESGDLMAKGGTNQSSQRLLVNLSDPLADRDYVTEGVSPNDLSKGLPIVSGASADNDRLRDKDYQFPQDVKVTQILFDQILVSHSLFLLTSGAHIYAGTRAMAGSLGRTQVTDAGVEYLEKGDRASDHLPTYCDLIVP